MQEKTQERKAGRKIWQEKGRAVYLHIELSFIDKLDTIASQAKTSRSYLVKRILEETLPYLDVERFAEYKQIRFKEDAK